MALRLTTAMSLVLATGLLAACNDDEVQDGTTTAESETGAVAVPEGVEMTEETAENPDAVENQADVAEMQATAEEETAEAVESVGEPADTELVETVDEDALEEEAAESDVVVLENETEVVTAESDEGLAGGVGADTVGPATETAEEGMTRENPATDAATATDMADGSDIATVPAEGSLADEEPQIAETGTAMTEDMVEEMDGADVADLNSTGELDAEAQAEPGSGTDVAVEETNDVATDGIDSGSELTMTDLDNLVLDQEGVQRLTSYIEDSDAFTPTQKVTLVAGIDAARDDPQRFSQLMDQIREIVASAE